LRMSSWVSERQITFQFMSFYRSPSLLVFELLYRI
jgi:hypothetical protein